MSEEKTPTANPQIQAAAMQMAQLDDSQLQPVYMNFCRVTGTPEEVILDFGLNVEPFKRPTQPMRLSQRIVCNFFTAKRLLMALSLAVQKHEKDFGLVETDVNKRVRHPEPQN